MGGSSYLRTWPTACSFPLLLFLCRRSERRWQGWSHWPIILVMWMAWPRARSDDHQFSEDQADGELTYSTFHFHSSGDGYLSTKTGCGFFNLEPFHPLRLTSWSFYSLCFISCSDDPTSLRPAPIYVFEQRLWHVLWCFYKSGGLNVLELVIKRRHYSMR